MQHLEMLCNTDNNASMYIFKDALHSCGTKWIFGTNANTIMVLTSMILWQQDDCLCMLMHSQNIPLVQQLPEFHSVYYLNKKWNDPQSDSNIAQRTNP